MRFFTSALTLASVLSLAACIPSQPGDEDATPTLNPNPRTVIGSDARPATVLLPSSYDTGSRYPLVFLLHGYGATSALQDLIFGLKERVDDAEFVLVLPEGTVDSTGKQFWNATPECCDWDGSGVDDVAYLTGLLDEALMRYAVDADRVAFVGHSNGGFMSYRMACEIGDRIDRIAPLAGSVFMNPADCAHPAPTSVLHMHGTADSTVPYLPDSFTVGAQAAVARWVERNACDTPDVLLGTADYLSSVPLEETEIHRWQGCTGGHRVELWKVNGGDHLFLSANDTYRDDLVSFLTE